MPTLEDCDPRPCILNWLQEREHRKKTTEKARTQRWFKGVSKVLMTRNFRFRDFSHFDRDYCADFKSENRF